MAKVFGKLKKQMPQRSNMTDQEQLDSPEEGAQEQGYLETLEDAANSGQAPDPTILNGAVGIGSIESNAEKEVNALRKYIQKNGHKFSGEEMLRNNAQLHNLKLKAGQGTVDSLEGAYPGVTNALKEWGYSPEQISQAQQAVVKDPSILTTATNAGSRPLHPDMLMRAAGVNK